MPDRDMLGGLPQIPLADLPRPIDRPLERAPRQEQRPHLAQIVIHDRLAAIKAQGSISSRTRTPGSFGSSRSSSWISSLNGSSFDGRAGPLITRRRIERNAALIVLRDSPVRRTSSLIETPRTKCSLRSSAHRSTSSTPFSRSRSTRSSQAHQHPGRLRHHPRGVNFQPAEGGQFSTGADTHRLAPAPKALTSHSRCSLAWVRRANSVVACCNRRVGLRADPAEAPGRPCTLSRADRPAPLEGWSGGH